MINIYFDEKGPQETFSSAGDPSNSLPFKHGSDKMKSYLLTGFSIPRENYKNFSKDFKSAISIYLESSNRKKSGDSEIKGEYIFKRFDRGVASIHYQQFLLLKSLNEIYDRNRCDLLTISSNKYSMAISAKLSNWFFHLSEQIFMVDPNLAALKFSITKYIEESASREVIEALLNPTLSANEFLNILKLDFERTVRQSTSSKFRVRNENLQIINHLIEPLLKSNLQIQAYRSDPEKMQWSFIEHFLDLWFTSKKDQNKGIYYTAFLDRGIPKKIFTKSINENPETISSHINENLDSSEVVGIQFADIFASLTGKLLSGLVHESKPRDNNSDQRHLIDDSYYSLKEHQFESAKLINKFLFEKDSEYGFIFDPSSSDEYILKTYLAEICSYDSFDEYKKISPIQHAEKHLYIYQEQQGMVITNLNSTINLSKSCFGSFQNAVNQKIILPL